MNRDIFTALSRDTERRGTLHYEVTMWDGSIDHRSMDGWFMLSRDHLTVNARKVRGRNRWQLTRTANVSGFTPHA
jgi:hypothetical protein